VCFQFLGWLAFVCLYCVSYMVVVAIAASLSVFGVGKRGAVVETLASLAFGIRKGRDDRCRPRLIANYHCRAHGVCGWTSRGKGLR
ncbi:MAG TPA: hypothetical protein VEC99_08245, partial [Clostridia bacterium]|nr:hypothetical protein [Clostridia bacterium]